MSTIIAGRFETQAHADQALEALENAGLNRTELQSFYLTAPGQHASYPIGGDAHHDEGTKKAGPKAMIGAAAGGAAGLAIGAVAGAAVAPALGVAGAIAGAGVGAYVSSLGAALSGTRGGDIEQASREEPVERPAGVIVAAHVDREGTADTVLRVLREQGAHDIEGATGEWRDGEWADFDPTKPPVLIDAAKI